MARKITDKQLYKLKNDELKAMFTQVTPYEFYRDVFPAGSLGVHGDLSVRKPNLIYTMTVRKDAADEKAKVYARNTIVFDDLEGLQGAAGAEFAVTSPVSYRGRNRTAANAYHLWGFCIDLDGVGMDQMHDLLYQIQNDVLPTPTYLINSGHGFHVYYLLEEPIPLYNHLHRPLNDLKHGLTRIVWNAYTSNIEPEKRQFQGIFQGFRMPGSQSKLGKRYPVVAFRVGEKTMIETLNRYVDDQYRMTDAEEYRMPLEEAKVKYPEWYQKRVVEGDRSRKKWDIKGKQGYALYDWWLNHVNEIKGGHRYFFLMCMAIYACKCDVPKKKLREDMKKAVAELERVEHRNPDGSEDHMHPEDIKSAMEAYDKAYYNFTINDIEHLTDVRIERNKRNGRKQELHLRLARGQLAILKDAGKCSQGRPSAKKKVEEYFEVFPDCPPKEAAAALEVSVSTIYKYHKYR